MKQIEKNTAPTERVQKTKQILAVILSLLLVFGLAACRSSRQTSAQTDTTQSNVAMETTEAEKTGAVEDFVKRFSEYFFSGNTEELRKCLAAGYQGAADGYTGETASDISVRTIAPIDDDNHLFASVQFVAGNEDSFTYLSMELIASEDGWKILSYGLEK